MSLLIHEFAKECVCFLSSRHTLPSTPSASISHMSKSLSFAFREDLCTEPTINGVSSATETSFVKISATPLAVRTVRMPSRSCEGRASQHAAAPARPGLLSRRRSPRCLAPPARCLPALLPLPQSHGGPCLHRAAQGKRVKLSAVRSGLCLSLQAALLPSRRRGTQGRSGAGILWQQSAAGAGTHPPARLPLPGRELGSSLWKPGSGFWPRSC